MACSHVDFTECKKGGFQPHTMQHSYSSKSHYGRITTLHRVSALYLDISPGNIKNMSSIKSNDICFKCSFLFSLFFFFMKNRVHFIVWGKGCVISAREQYTQRCVREVRRQRQEIHPAGLTAGKSTVPVMSSIIFMLTFAYIFITSSLS